MGYFGIGLSENDQYLDTYDEFFTLYDKGHEVAAISAQLIESARKELLTEQTSPDPFCFWYALATAQWECKQLQPEVYQQVKHSIDHNLDVVFWEPADRAKRKAVLEKLLQKISIERPKAKPRKKKKAPLFQKGDCIAIKLANGNYGGVVILEALFSEEHMSQNLAAFTRINMATRPVLEDFKNAQVLITNFEFDNDKQAFQRINWIYQYKQNTVKELLEVVGNISVIYQYHPTKNYGFGCGSGPWFGDASGAVLKQYASEQTKPVYIHTKTIKELTESDTWRFW